MNTTNTRLRLGALLLLASCKKPLERLSEDTANEGATSFMKAFDSRTSVEGGFLF